MTAAILAAAIPGLIGLISGGLGAAGVGSQKEKYQQFPALNPQQTNLLQSRLGGEGTLGQNPLYEQLTRSLSDIIGGQDQGMSALENQYQTKFRQEIMPSLLERFTGGSRGSSGLNQAFAGAGQSLAETLAAMQAHRQMQALGLALPAAQAPFQEDMSLLGVQPFQGAYTPSQPSPFSQLGAGIFGDFGKILSGASAFGKSF